MNYCKSNTGRHIVKIQNTKSVSVICDKWKYKSSVEQKYYWSCCEEYSGNDTCGNKAYLLYILTGILALLAYLFGEGVSFLQIRGKDFHHSTVDSIFLKRMVYHVFATTIYFFIFKNLYKSVFLNSIKSIFLSQKLKSSTNICFGEYLS